MLCSFQLALFDEKNLLLLGIEPLMSSKENDQIGDFGGLLGSNVQVHGKLMLN